jgi:hypothetical protein
MLQLAAKDKQQEELIQQNKELQNTMKEMIPHLGNNNNNTKTHITSRGASLVAHKQKRGGAAFFFFNSISARRRNPRPRLRAATARQPGERHR